MDKDNDEPVKNIKNPASPNASDYLIVQKQLGCNLGHGQTTQVNNEEQFLFAPVKLNIFKKEIVQNDKELFDSESNGSSILGGVTKHQLTLTFGKSAMDQKKDQKSLIAIEIDSENDQNNEFMLTEEVNIGNQPL